MASDIGQRRPTKFSSAQISQASCQKGIDFLLGHTDKETPLQLWVTALNQDIINNGMDSVIRIPNATWTAETNVITSYGSATPLIIDPWLNQLKTGVRLPNGTVQPVCPYDSANLRHLGLKILNSLTLDFKTDIAQAVGIDADGLTIWKAIIQRRVLISPLRQRKLIHELEVLRLQHQEGENIEQFNLKIRDLVMQICNAGAELAERMNPKKEEKKEAVEEGPLVVLDTPQLQKGHDLYKKWQDKLNGTRPTGVNYSN